VSSLFASLQKDHSDALSREAAPAADVYVLARCCFDLARARTGSVCLADGLAKSFIRGDKLPCPARDLRERSAFAHTLNDRLTGI
jgi:hypothetical protein